jgi:hypothetical protein
MCFHQLASGTGGLKAAKLPQQFLLKNVMHLPMSAFFDVTPVGRVLVLFSSDMNVVNVVLPGLFHTLLSDLFRVSKIVPFL